MKTIGILTTIQGHKSIAQAIEQTLCDEYKVVTFSETDVLFKIYGIFYKYFPFLFIGPFVAGSNKQMLSLARHLFYQRYIKAIKKFDQQHNIDLFINTFWMYESVLEKLADASNRPLINVLADPKTFHPTSIGLPPAINIGFDNDALERCRTYYPQSTGVPMGWFVRPEFEVSYDQQEVRARLQLPAKQPIILFVTGSDGVESVQKIISRMQISTPATLIVACGHNQALYQKIRQLSAKLMNTWPSLQLLALPFTTEIHTYMQAADLIVGKAGPNMLFESVATLTPFMATTHVAGQETGNLELILEKQLGYVEENLSKAAALLSQILQQPDQLQRFQPSLKTMATYNRQAKTALRQTVAQLLGN